jgi:vitamin B12 transporter
MMRSHWCVGWLTATVLPLWAAGPLAAQTPADTAGLPEIVVTATRYAVPPESLSATLTVLRGDDLRAQGIVYVSDALREVPGLQVVQGGSFGAATSLFIRGGESDYTKVLVDGVPLNQPGGAYDFASLTTDNVERIEVLRGPASVLYGSDAVSGVVQIITRAGRGPAEAQASIEAGSYGTARWDAGGHGSAGGLGWSGSLSRTTTNGTYAFNNDYRNTVASARLSAGAGGRTEGSLAFRLTDAKFNFPTDFSGALTDGNQFNTERTTTLSAEVAHRLPNGLEGHLLVGRNAVTSGYDNQPDPVPGPGDFSVRDARVRREIVDARALYSRIPRTTVLAGVAYDHQHEHTISDGDFGPDEFTAARHNWGLYLQGSSDPVHRLRLTAGGRLDDNSRFGTFWTYRVSALAFATRSTRLRVSAGNAFKEPSFFENFATGFVVGNPNLKPERSTSFEGGIEQDLAGGRVVASVTGFAQRFRDLIQYTGTPLPGQTSNYFNVGGANANGVEASVQVRRIGPVEATASYTWLKTKVTDAGFEVSPDADFVTGQPLLRRPEHAVSVRVASDPRARGQAGVALTWVGARDDLRFSALDPTRRITLPSYATVDVSGSYNLRSARRGPGFALTGRVENLFDKAYAQVAGFPARSRTLLVGVASTYR